MPPAISNGVRLLGGPPPVAAGASGGFGVPSCPRTAAVGQTVLSGMPLLQSCGAKVPTSVMGSGVPEVFVGEAPGTSSGTGVTAAGGGVGGGDGRGVVRGSAVGVGRCDSAGVGVGVGFGVVRGVGVGVGVGRGVAAGGDGGAAAEVETADPPGISSIAPIVTTSPESTAPPSRRGRRRMALMPAA